MEQKSPQWYEARFGNFSGSEFWKLMTNGKAKDKLFGDTALTYINDKVSEIITNGTIIDYKSFRSKETDWGNTYEPVAVEKFELKKGLKTNETGFILIKPRFGCSPDRVLEKSVLEVKCPYNTNNHIDHLELTSGKDLLCLSKPYYTQVQIEIMATNSEKGYFVSFDPRCSEVLQLKILEVERDKEYIKEIEFRYQEALKLLNSKLDRLFELALQ